MGTQTTASPHEQRHMHPYLKKLKCVLRKKSNDYGIKDIRSVLKASECMTCYPATV